MKRIAIISTVLIFGLAAVPNFALSQESGGNKAEIEALQNEINEKNKKVRELEENIEAYKKKISQKQLESVSLTNQIAILDNRMAQVDLDIESTEIKIESVALQIKSLDLSIDEKEEIIEHRKQTLSEFIRVLHYENSKKPIEVLAAYEKFSDFYNRIQYLQKIEQDLGAQAKTLRLAKADMENKKEEAEKHKQSYEELNETLGQKYVDLEEQTQTKEELLNKTHSSEQVYKTLVANLRSQYKEIEQEIAVVEREIRKKLNQNDSFNDLSGDSAVLSWPTQSRYVTAHFHDPGYPYRHIFEHSGVDVRSSQGTPVMASASGYIGRAKLCSSSSCYSYVMIIHSGGISTLYGHLSQIFVKDDQFVTRGDLIGYSGGTPGAPGAGPFTTGPHLHFEVRQNGIPTNPLNYLIKDY